MPYSTIFGIDSHARTTTICALVVGTGESRMRTYGIAFRGKEVLFGKRPRLLAAGPARVDFSICVAQR